MRPNFGADQRIIAISDIHGNLLFFRGLLEKIQFSRNDVLILVGDILEKGAESLALMEHLMQLCKTYQVYPVCGNCDGLVLRFFEGDEWDNGFFRNYLPRHPECTIRQMAQAIGFTQYTDLPLLRETLRESYPRHWQWLRDMPTIVETEHLLFVHGGVPSLEQLEQLDAWRCMKYDNFWRQGLRFDKYIVVGHWPVTLYHPDYASAAPILDREHKVLSIDGGCVLKLDGQLNALIFPRESSEDFFWDSYDGLPTAVALDEQVSSLQPLNIRWGRSKLEILEQGEEFSWCRHMETGRKILILSDFLHTDGDTVWCEDATDYCLAVSPGDVLSISRQTSRGYLAKKDGVTGWYMGRIGAIVP